MNRKEYFIDKLFYPKKKVLLVSIQKSGTHLVKKVLEYAGLKGKYREIVGLKDFKGLKNNEFLWSHFCPSDDIQAALEKNDDYKIIFNFRDPRDVIVSWFHWTHPNNQKTIHAHMDFMQQVYSNFTDEQLMDMFIRCDKLRPDEYNPLEYFRLCRVLLFHPSVCKVRFEELIGQRGGGNSKLQVQTIHKIYDYLNIEQVSSQECADKLFSKKSLTFRKGKINQFKKNLKRSELVLLQKLHGDILAQYGYEIYSD